MNNHDANPIIRKLESIFDLSDEERNAVVDLPLQVRVLKAGQDIVRERDRPSQCCALLDGLACRYKLIGEGKRQIFSFHIAGDIPDLQSLHLSTMDHNVSVLTDAKVGFVPHDALRDLVHSHPRIADALWRETLIDGSVFRQWMVGLGRREAPERIAHFFCEHFTRSNAVQLAEGYTFPMQMTQEELGDALGTSTVHVNRTVQGLRERNLIAWSRRVMTIKDWKGLQAAAEFDPTYLHLRRAA
jgi:CRP-like cAMP-binding protein